MVYGALKQPSLLSEALDKIAASQAWSSIPTNPSVDIETLCGVPMLQSMYAETLRM